MVAMFVIKTARFDFFIFDSSRLCDILQAYAQFSKSEPLQAEVPLYIFVLFYLYYSLLCRKKSPNRINV
jgi:hypothetical protein